MRNLKRALSLTLASVMLLGMMVVGASAAGFPDVDEDNANIEAIEVLQAVEVMIGDDNGNFGPNDPVNRSQMAVVMAKLLNLDYQYYEASCPFWDVPTWARPYVGACYANKIVSGYGDGTYGAADGVTPVQAASMMMRALGYFQHSEDYQDGFETATVRQGTEIGIFEGVGSSATANMTRAQVARMALNALESEMVTFTGVPGTTYTTSTGEQLSIGYRAEYTPRTSTELKYKAIEDRTSDASLDSNHRGQYYIQLGEELYNGKLVKKFDRDIFERPSINWQYDGKEIGIYVDYDLKVAEYLSAVKYNTLYDELTYTTIRDNDVLRFVDGKETTPFSKDNFARSNKNDLESSGTGVLTEVFHDQQNKEITITSINTYLAQANNDYNTTNESLSMKVYDSKTGTTKIVDSTDVPAAANVKKDEYRLVYMSAKENPSYEVVRMFDVEVMSDSEVTKWSKDGTKVVDKLTTGGTEYSANVKAFYDKANDVFEDYDYQLLTDITYNIYLDRYGNVIGVDEAEGVRNYVFITGYDRGKSHIATKTADANAIFLDGTMDVITVNVTDTNKNISNTKLNMGTYDVWNVQDGKVNENRWYTFTQSANGNYTLKPVARSIYTAYTSDDLGTDGVKTLNTANLYLDDSHVGTKYDSTAAYERQGRIYGNDDSIYITVEPGRVDLSCNVPSHDVNSSTNTSIDNVKDAITDVAGVYTGAQNVKIDLSLETKQEINRDGHYDEDGKEINNGDCETGHEEHGDTNYKSSNERNAYVYSIYDSNYYVIASVVLGEAQGGAANYVYVLDGAKNERVERASSSKSSNGDTYYWEFEAVVDGEITTLTVKEKYSDTLKSNLKIHSLQEIRFDGDYVTAIKDIPVNDVFINYQGADTAKVPEKVKTDDMDVYDVGYVYNQDEWKTVGDYMDGDGKPTKSNESTKMAEMRDIFSDYRWTTAQRAGRIDGTIQLVGRTLYTDRANGDVGLALNTNAKAVLIQPENGKRVATNCGSVSEAIGRLADRYPDETANPGIQFQGRIAAVLDSNGAAKWVVIISDTNLRTGNNPDYGYNGRTYYLDLSGELFSGYSNSTSVWSSAENNNRGGYVEGYNLNSNTSGWGNTTRYEVRSGSTVVVRNYYTDAQMNWYFNNVYMDDIMEWNGRDGYTFVMPSENVAIEGRHNMQYTNNIAGFTSEKIGSSTNVTFDGKSAGVDLGAGVNTVNVKITMPGRSVSSLENGKWYTVTIGEYQENVDVRCVNNALSFEYTVTARDRNAKRIMVWDINLAKNQGGTPVDPDTTPVKTVEINSTIPESFETADQVPTGAQTLTVVTDPTNAATATLTWGTPVNGVVTGTIKVTANAGYNLTGTEITLGGVEITNGYTVTATIGIDEGEEVTVKLGESAKDDQAAKAVTATAANGKVAVKGLGTNGMLKALVVKAGAVVEETSVDGTMNWPEGAELWVLKGKKTHIMDEDTGLILPGEIKFDYTEAGIAPASRMRKARAAEEARTYTFTDRYLGYATITLGNVSYTLEMVNVKFSDGTTANGALKFLKKDTTKVAVWLEDETNDLEKALSTIDEEWTESTVPVELPGKGDIVEIPLDENGNMVLNVEYTPDEASITEENAMLVIKAKPGVEQKYEINGELVTEEGMTPTKGDIAEPVDKNDPLVTGLPFTLSVSIETKPLTKNGKTKVSDIQKNVDVVYNEETKTFAVTGDLIYNKGLTDYSSSGTRNVGYFVALDLDWSEMPAGYEIKLGTYKDNDPKQFVLKDLNSETKAELILGKVAGSDGKKLELEGRGIKVINKRDDSSVFYTFDFSGLTTNAPELLEFSEVDEKADKLGGKEISAIQTGVKVAVQNVSDTERTVKLTGTLHPVIDKWTAFGGDGYNTGYIVAIQVDGSAVTDTTFNAINPNGKPGVSPNLSGDNTLYVRVADLAETNKQAATKGNAIIYASNGSRMVTYTLDFSGLTLEQIGSGDVKLTAPGQVTLKNSKVNTSSFQKNINIVKKGDTFYISGELNPVKLTNFSSEEKYQKGYYIALNVDAEDVTGAGAWSARGTTAGDAASAKDDLVIFLGDTKLTNTNDKEYQIYVLSKKYAGEAEGTPTDALKEYTLDVSGVTLVADPGAKPVADYEQIKGLGSSVMNEATDKAKLFYGTDIQDGVTFTYDPSTKTYTAKGTLNKVENWVGFSKSEPETRSGWYVALKIEGSYADDPTKVGKTEGSMGTIAGKDTCVIRVADKDGNAAAQELFFQIGSDKDAVTIKIDLSGLTLSETVATPNGQFVDLAKANIESVTESK